jgi:hypothetical protein
MPEGEDLDPTLDELSGPLSRNAPAPTGAHQLQSCDPHRTFDLIVTDEFHRSI